MKNEMVKRNSNDRVVKRNSNDTVAFAMANYCDSSARLDYLRLAVDSVWRQSDPNWILIIVDDASPYAGTDALLEELVERDRDRITVITSTKNRYQGYCRNLAAQRAADLGVGLIAYLDSDDEAHEDRVAVAKERFAVPSLDFLYSSFVVIDELSRELDLNRLTPSIQEIISSHDSPVEGRDAWVKMGTITGYTTLTSTVTVRTNLACREPFPIERVSEDMHAWFRMAARAEDVAFEARTPSRYRIPTVVQGSSVRARVGSGYYLEKARVDADGFLAAVEIAVECGKLQRREAPGHWARFLTRLALTMASEGEDDLAALIRAHRDLCVIEGGLTPLVLDPLTTGP